MEALQLGNEEFEGDNTVYLFDGGDPLTLVDTGMGTETARSELTVRLDDRGYEIADIAKVVLTHWHADHSGLAGLIQSRGDAEVEAHPREAGLVSRDEDTVDAYRNLARTTLDRWRVPDSKREEILEFIETDGRLWDSIASVEHIEAGETTCAGTTELTARDTPGHTAGHLSFEFECDGERCLLSGDAILPHYTPNIGGSDLRLDNPVQAYLDTLQWIVDGEFDTILPGHRNPIHDPAARARDIVEHSETRTRRVCEALDDLGPTDVWSISHRLFGELDAVHIMNGPGEVQAHLTYLEKQGRVSGENGIYRANE